MKYSKTFEQLKSKPAEFMSDLYDVGTRKSVGYLPYNNIKMYGDDSVENVIVWCNSKNLKYVHLLGSTGSDGAFYVYDYIMLDNLLKKYSDILIDANIPTEPDEYVIYIEKNLVHPQIYPDAYRVIGLTFNDKRFEFDKI